MGALAPEPPVAAFAPREIPSTGRHERRRREAARALADELGRRVDGEVRFDAGSRALYSTDASNYRQVPIGVVLPRSVEDAVEAVAVCRRHDAPVLPRGAGTSLAGQCCNVAVVIDFSRHVNRIVTLDPRERAAWVEPGVVLDALRRAAERHGLTFGPDPATHTHCTLGGMIGNDSCGVHSVMAGRTSDNVLMLEVLLYDGTRLVTGAVDDARLERFVRTGGRRGAVYGKLRALRDREADEVRRRFPRLERRVSGYSLERLLPEAGFDVAKALVGTEGTCALVLRAKVRLVESPPARALVVLGYEDVFAAADAVPEVRRFGPIGLEGIDDRLADDMRRKRFHVERLKLLPEGKAWLLVELGGADRREADAAARRMIEALARGAGAPAVARFDDPRDEAVVWKVRESALGVTARVPGRRDAWEGWEDAAVPPERLGAYLRDLRRLLDLHGYSSALYGHFGQGCVHTRIDFDLTSREGIRRYRAFVEEAADLVVSHGGALSGEHGDGQSRAELLGRMYGPRLVAAFREFKAIWDPAGRMNPGKVVDPYRLDENLRLGAGYVDARPRTRFRFADDEGRFGRAVARCVGVGACRRERGGVMCPSWRATHEEMHSTRGRARLLFEMLNGTAVGGGWRDRHVKEALDLCLACKGCKSDCPVNVDLATYKAEFLSHYYARRLRPRAAYAMGLVMYWARVASLAPRAANAAARSPLLGRALKSAAGIDQRREIPLLARYSFRRWFAARRAAAVPGRRVLLFPDTFVDFFRPDIGVAAVEALERAGFAPGIPRRRVCCGRPLYDHGMLRLARRHLLRLLDELSPAVDAGVPVVVLEPSCAAVFRDELISMLPHDPRARRLASATRTFAELLAREGADVRLPRVSGDAVVQGHCHQHAVIGLDAERLLLERVGLRPRLLDDGCCGMAGAFGMEAGRRCDVSLAIGDLGVLQAVRAAPGEALLVANGFSCREQIRQGTGRRALHVAEVVARAAAVEAGLAADRAALPLDGSSAGVAALAPLPWAARAARGTAWAIALAVAVAAGARWRRSRAR